MLTTKAICWLVIMVVGVSVATTVQSTEEWCNCLNDCTLHWVTSLVDNEKNLYHGMCGPKEDFSDLDLNLCLGNQNGTLAWQDRGGGMVSCACDSRRGDTASVDCYCLNDIGKSVHNFINMYDGIKYDVDRGVMYCYNNYGAKVEKDIEQTGANHTEFYCSKSRTMEG